jgi:hypothetical protein
VLLTTLTEDGRGLFLVTCTETFGFIEYRLLSLIDIEDNAPNDICGILSNASPFAEPSVLRL